MSIACQLIWISGANNDPVATYDSEELVLPENGKLMVLYPGTTMLWKSASVWVPFELVQKPTWKSPEVKVAIHI